MSDSAARTQNNGPPYPFDSDAECVTDCADRSSMALVPPESGPNSLRAIARLMRNSKILALEPEFVDCSARVRLKRVLA